MTALGSYGTVALLFPLLAWLLTGDDDRSADAAFMAWLSHEGVQLDGIVLREGAHGHGLYASSPLKRGARVVCVPPHITVTREDVLGEGLGHSENATTLELLTAFLVKVKHSGTASPWWPAVSMLPVVYDTPLWWSEDERRMLPPSMQEDLNKTEARMHAHLQRARTWEVFSDQQVDMQEYKWAWSAVRTRVAALPHVGIAFIPLLDMMNHGETGALERWRGSICVRANRNMARGEELRVSYGNRTNRDLLENYGFIVSNNPCKSAILACSRTERLYDLRLAPGRSDASYLHAVRPHGTDEWDMRLALDVYGDAKLVYEEALSLLPCISRRLEELAGYRLPRLQQQDTSHARRNMVIASVEDEVAVLRAYKDMLT